MDNSYNWYSVHISYIVQLYSVHCTMYSVHANSLRTPILTPPHPLYVTPQSIEHHKYTPR